MLGIFSNVFEKFVKNRNKKYDKGDKKIVHSEVPVISVGNLSVGGTGKTPFVEMLARQLLRIKRRPAIIGRGYKRSGKGEIIVCDGKEILTDARTAGDEMFLLADKLKVPVIAHKSKSDAAVEAPKKFDIDSIIIDDGFQHRRLFRDIDILLIDEATLDDPRLIPEGRLREPLSSVGRADIVCLMGNFGISDELRKNLTPNQIVIWANGFPARPYDVFTKKKLFGEKYKEFRNSMIIISGIAKPERFENMLKGMKYNVLKHISFDDHHKYTKRDMEQIAEACREKGVSMIGTTEKDAAKLLRFEEFFNKNNLKCYVFPFYLKITKGRSVFQKSIRSVFTNSGRQRR